MVIPFGIKITVEIGQNVFKLNVVYRGIEIAYFHVCDSVQHAARAKRHAEKILHFGNGHFVDFQRFKQRVESVDDRLRNMFLHNRLACKPRGCVDTRLFQNVAKRKAVKHDFQIIVFENVRNLHCTKRFATFVVHRDFKRVFKDFNDVDAENTLRVGHRRLLDVAAFYHIVNVKYGFVADFSVLVDESEFLLCVVFHVVDGNRRHRVVHHARNRTADKQYAHDKP